MNCECIENSTQYINIFNNDVFSEAVSEYCKTAKKSFMVWPPHCVFGTWGHNIHNLLYKTLNDSEQRVWYYAIGRSATNDQFNCIDEHNKSVRFQNPTNYYVCGFTGSCHVYETVKHLITFNVQNNTNDKIYVIEDCVGDVENNGDSFLNNYKKLHYHKLIELVKSSEIFK